MTTTRFSLCVFCLCLFASCGKGEKKADEPVQVKVAQAETQIPSSEREFSVYLETIQGNRAIFQGGWPD